MRGGVRAVGGVLRCAFSTSSDGGTPSSSKRFQATARHYIALRLAATAPPCAVQRRSLMSVCRKLLGQLSIAPQRRRIEEVVGLLQEGWHLLHYGTAVASSGRSSPQSLMTDGNLEAAASGFHDFLSSNSLRAGIHALIPILTPQPRFRGIMEPHHPTTPI